MRLTHWPAKVAQGIKDWRPELCVGQIKLDGCNADMGLENLTIEEAVQRGAKTMVIGVGPTAVVISQTAGA